MKKSIFDDDEKDQEAKSEREIRKMILTGEIQKLKMHKDGDSTIAPILQDRKLIEIDRIENYWKYEEPELDREIRQMK